MAALFRKILCPVDFNDNSMAALDLACKLAEQNDVPLCVMHVVPFPIAASEIGPLPSESLPEWERGALVKLEEIAEKRIPKTINCQVMSRSGQPVEVIVSSEAELGADLVVMATHGRGRSAVGHFFMGSVAERVVRESACPVLVVPPR